jgi:hypothetical protein
MVIPPSFFLGNRTSLVTAHGVLWTNIAEWKKYVSTKLSMEKKSGYWMLGMTSKAGLIVLKVTKRCSRRQQAGLS